MDRKTITHFATRLTYAQHSGLLLQEVAGPLGWSEINAIAPVAMRDFGGAHSVVTRLDKAVLAMDKPMLGYREFLPVGFGAYVCNVEQLGFMHYMAGQAAQLGLTRIVFLESEIEMAMNWATRHAQIAALEGSHR